MLVTVTVPALALVLFPLLVLVVPPVQVDVSMIDGSVTSIDARTVPLQLIESVVTM